MGSGASRGNVVQISVEVQTEPWKLLEDQHAMQNPSQKGHEMLIADPKDIWLKVDETLDVPKGQKNPNQNLVVKRSGWKTIRIFVSSTFRDFHHEREVLVKQVFPDLRNWCEQRRLHLVDCDLRWGVPKDSTTELTLKTCLGELDRCYQDNVMPFFLNLTSERIGWVPLPSEVPENLVQEYQWVFGLSVTEMEIVHGAYRKDNPNSFFVFRNDGFIDTLPEDIRGEFVDENVLAPSKIKVMKKMIEERFPKERILYYDVAYDGINPDTKRTKLTLDESFTEKIFNFFKSRIEQQYPLFEGEEDILQKRCEAHEAFMKSRGDVVLGRADILADIASYVQEPERSVPLLILGQPGMGKSSVMAKAADDTNTLALNHKIPCSDKRGWHVFYHFVGAVPGSTDLFQMLCRLLKELGAVDTSMPTDCDIAVSLVLSALSNPSSRPVIIFVDALNQLDEETASTLCTWVPRKLLPRVRCIFSMINQTPQHRNLMSRETKPIEYFLKPLSLWVRKDMVKEYLGKFNKRLDLDQTFLLLTKEASENPLWLSIACEELRVFGNYRLVSDKINSLPDGLLDLLEVMLTRFEQEGGGHLLVATLCLIEVSTFGLLESELLTLLADEENLMPVEEQGEKSEKDQNEKGHKSKSYKSNLAAFKWASVYRALRPFLRPFGDSGEGRLDFYHRTLSKVVRKKYLKSYGVDEDDEEVTKTSKPNQENDEELSDLYRWWHTKLADYFEVSDNYDRKVEEYPYHLVRLGDSSRLQTFLCQWPAIDGLYDEEYSGKLLKYWSKCGGFEKMVQCYSKMLQELRQAPNTNDELLCNRYVQIGKILTQGGQYDEAKALGLEALVIEKRLGDRKHQMIEIYTLLAHIWDQKGKLFEYISADQIPGERQAMLYQDAAMRLLEEMKDQGKQYKLKLGNVLVKSAFTLATFADCGGDTDLNKTDALQKGIANVERAENLFRELKDNGKLAEAYMTHGVLCRYSQSIQHKFYKKAEELCQETYGDYHPLMARILLNTGITCEDGRDFKKAFAYFKRYYETMLDVYGDHHPKTSRATKILQEPIYKRLANLEKPQGDERSNEK